MSALAMLDAGRAINHRIKTLALHALASLVAVIGVVFALVAARIELTGLM